MEAEKTQYFISKDEVVIVRWLLRGLYHSEDTKYYRPTVSEKKHLKATETETQSWNKGLCFFFFFTPPPPLPTQTLFNVRTGRKIEDFEVRNYKAVMGQR